jgi:hypothetical protein
MKGERLDRFLRRRSLCFSAVFFRFTLPDLLLAPHRSEIEQTASSAQLLTGGQYRHLDQVPDLADSDLSILSS